MCDESCAASACLCFACFVARGQPKCNDDREGHLKIAAAFVRR